MQAEGFLPDTCQRECLQRLDHLRAGLLDRRSAQTGTLRGLYMYGGVGTGKTMMLDLFYKELTASGVRCERQHFHEFLQAVHRRLHLLRKRVGSEPGLLRRAAYEYKDDFPVLAFDEAHVLNVGDALMLRTFFEAYFEAGGVMVATSNVAPDDLYASGINREVFLPFLDALKERCDFFLMKGRHDYRSVAADAGRLRGVFLWQESDVPIGTASPRQFPALCEALGVSHSSTPADAPADVDVGFGRTLRCERTWSFKDTAGAVMRRVVHFEFNDLCRTATGPSEWVGLAEYADAIIVTGVPHFADYDEDAARRFITFVDIVYDKQRFLVITAAASPEKIFSELIGKYAGDDDFPEQRNSGGPPLDDSLSTQGMSKSGATSGSMKMPSHGLASGRHGVVFQRPKQLQYSANGAYVPAAPEEPVTPVPHAASVTRTGGRAEHGVGDAERVMQGVVEENSEWVEWSATGLKDASLFDLSPIETNAQVTDKLLPFRRCASRLHQMQPRI